MSLWDLTAVIGTGVAVAGFIVLCLMLFWGRKDAPNHWDEKTRE